MTATAELAADAPRPENQDKPPASLTADEAEAIAKALDAERAEVARRYQEHDRHHSRVVDPEWSATMREISEAGLALDQKRAEAKRTAKRLRDRETSWAQWKAAFAVADEHRQICESIRVAADALLLALEAELELHEQLRQASGASKLAIMNADLDKLRRLRTSAAIVAEVRPEPPRNGGAHDPR